MIGLPHFLRANDDEMYIPETAKMEPKMSNINSGNDINSDNPFLEEKPELTDDARIIAEASIQVQRFQKERERLQVLCAEATLAVEGSNRRVQSLELENIELRNNLQALQAQCEELRQEASDLRAFFSSIKAQFAHFEIPLPVRKRVKNGNGNGKKTEAK